MDEKEKDLEEKKITFRKRVALLEGACGQAGRVQICGQVVDLLISPEAKEQEWEPFHNVPLSSLTTISPIEDWDMSGVRGARLQVDILKVASQDFRLEQAESYDTLFSSPLFSANNKGFFHYLLPPIEDLKKGDYVTRVILRGVNSARQNILDLRYVNDASTEIFQKEKEIGYGKLHILEEDFEGFVLISDIDKTFLDTDIESKDGLFKTLTESARDKKAIPGMPELYRQLISSEEGLGAIFFLSASPHFFRRTLTSLLDDHKIKVDALYLKYLSALIDSLGQKVFQLLSNPFQILKKRDLRSMLSEGMKYISSNIWSLFDQVGYKLEMLLRNRLMQPRHSKEILVGDNSEGDFFIFVLYQLLLKGYCLGKGLEDYLAQFNFLGRDALTKESAQRIYALTKENIDLHGKRNPVHAIWINYANKERDEKTMKDIILDSLSPDLKEACLKDKEILFGRLCQKGFAMALASFDEGLLSLDGLKAVFETSREEEEAKEELQETLEKFVFQKRKDISPLSLKENFL